MTFVNEPVPADAIEKYDLNGFVGPFGPRKVIDLDLSMWTIDHERLAFLLYTGGGGGPHQGAPRRKWYGLWWNGEIAHFEGDEVVTLDSKGQLLTWDHAALKLPNHTKIPRNLWIEVLQEALEEKGLGFNRNFVYAVVCVYKQTEEYGA